MIVFDTRLLNAIRRESLALVINLARADISSWSGIIVVSCLQLDLDNGVGIGFYIARQC
jgi:hypothetical protein